MKEVKVTLKGEHGVNPEHIELDCGDVLVVEADGSGFQRVEVDQEVPHELRQLGDPKVTGSSYEFRFEALMLTGRWNDCHLEESQPVELVFHFVFLPSMLCVYSENRLVKVTVSRWCPESN